jgi:molybdenum cofactor cytidylyltransferase
MRSPADAERVAGILLAAGASTRMGRNKMLIPLGGEPLVRRTATRALTAGLSPLVVVLGHEAAAVREALSGLPCEFVVNPSYRGSTSSSLHRGLERLSPELGAVVVLLADMVQVDAEMIAHLVRRARETHAPLAASRYGDVLAPPLFFRRALFPELLAWHGEGCGKAVVRAHADEAQYVDWPDSALTDLDTPEDLAGFLGQT